MAQVYRKFISHLPHWEDALHAATTAFETGETSNGRL